MNGYLMLFAALTLLIMPITFQARVRLCRHPTYWFAIQAAGLPILRKTPRRDQERRVSKNTLKGAIDKRETLVAKALLNPSAIRRLLSALTLKSLRIDALIAFEDASSTALTFTALNAISHAVPGKVKMYTAAAFDARGSEILISCVITLRVIRLMGGPLTAREVKKGRASAPKRFLIHSFRR